MPVPETFCDVIEVLNRENVRYVVVGSVAVVLHGTNRDVCDLDIVVDPSPDEAQRCMHALALAGFMPSIPLPLPVHLLTVVRLFDQSTREVDVFVRNESLFKELWSSCKLVPLGNQTARIAGLEQVSHMKRIYNGPLMRENEKLNLSLRDATPEDEPFLFAVYASTRIEELQGTGWSDEQKQAFIRMQFLARERTHPRVDDRIILRNGQPIGRMMVDRDGAAIVLRDIAVLTEYRNAGVGSRLIQDLMKETASAGKPIHLHVLASSPAVRLYERLGFSRIGEEAAYLEMKWVPATG
ncbi:MAG TPA: GNAT family N-acetyltransferase [Pyrinomonadaceae bacterium]|nr:GNAT family N-acetyltransferase [Pyrinomonadaceae bacterium]